MATEKQWTFEEVDAHIEKHLPHAKHQMTAAAGAGAICNVYQAVRPILLVLKSLPLIPQRWKDAIALLISALDAMCPQH